MLFLFFDVSNNNQIKKHNSVDIKYRTNKLISPISEIIFSFIFSKIVKAFFKNRIKNTKKLIKGNTPAFKSGYKYSLKILTTKHFI